MIQKPKSPAIIQNDILEALLQTGVKQTAPGGKARAFADVIGHKIAETETSQYLNLAQTVLPFATGDSLERLGEIYGVRRIRRTDPSVSQTDSNFKFYTRTGTFGSINNGNSISIPAGTRIMTDSSTGPVYITDSIVLPASAFEQVFGATSLNVGSAGNAAAGVFTRHNFTNYADGPFGTLLVTNNYGIVGGRDDEDDESYRFRINLKLQSHGGAAKTDLEGALLQLPGIQDIVFERKAGTFNVYVYGISPTVSPSLLQLVQSEIDRRTAYPLTGTALTPDLVGTSLSTVVKLQAGLSAAEKPGILASAARAAEEYINNLGVGNSLIINEIADRIRKADSRIVDIGEPNKPLQEIFIWRGRDDGTRYSRFLVSNYDPEVGERIVVEDIPSAVTLTAI